MVLLLRFPLFLLLPRGVKMILKRWVHFAPLLRMKKTEWQRRKDKDKGHGEQMILKRSCIDDVVLRAVAHTP